jgi:hypothetical protein
VGERSVVARNVFIFLAAGQLTDGQHTSGNRPGNNSTEEDSDYVTCTSVWKFRWWRGRKADGLSTDRAAN